MNQNFVETDLLIESAPMDPQFRGTLQEALDQYTTRLRIVTPYGLLRVVVSDVAPTSNVGLWLKNGTKPYVWDEVSSVYVPLDISDSLSFDYDTIVAIVLANFSLADAYLLDGRINRTGMIADGIITSAKFVEPFGPGHSVAVTDAVGNLIWVGLAKNQFLQANPTTGDLEAGNKDAQPIKFQSTPVVLPVLGGVSSIAHPLGQFPTTVQVWLQYNNSTPSYGYTNGDIVSPEAFSMDSPGNLREIAGVSAFNWMPSTTDVKVYLRNDAVTNLGITFYVYDRSTGDNHVADVNDWKVFIVVTYIPNNA